MEPELVELRDGATVIVRPVSPADRPLLAEAFERLGERSRYQRFLAPKKRLTEEELRFFTDVDHHDHEAIGAVDTATGQGVGIARFLRDVARPDHAEAAVAVVDGWQGLGVGGVMLERLAHRAREEGIRAFTASLLTENRAMLTLFRHLGDVRRRAEGNVSEIEVALPLDLPAPHLRQALRAAAAGGVELAR